MNTSSNGGATWVQCCATARSARRTRPSGWPLLVAREPRASSDPMPMAQYPYCDRTTLASSCTR